MRPRDPLQAWDAGDELVLSHLNEASSSQEPLPAPGRVALLNDAFGALGCALADLGPVIYSDSYLSHEGIRMNSGGALQPIRELRDLRGPFDLAILKLPKSLAFLDDQLCQLSQALVPGGRLVCAYMVKHQAPGAFDLIARRIGATTTSLASKKARLIFARREREPSTSPYPQEVRLDGFREPFLHPSLLFSREKLDIGTRFLLEHLPAPEAGAARILDLGCANGLLGIAARQANPAAQVVFTDESWMAVESARANYERRFADGRARFEWTHCAASVPAESIDLVLCNPPFHQGTSVGEHVARDMFREAHRVLRAGGRLRVVANSHLRYADALGRLFGGVERVAANRKFTILDAFKGPVRRATGSRPSA